MSDAESQMACGSLAVSIIAAIFGVSVKFSDIRSRKVPHPKRGLNLAEIICLFESIGLTARALRITFPERFGLQFPCIAHLRSRHFVVLLSCEEHQALIYDASGKLRYVQSDWMFSRFTFNFVEIQHCKPALDPTLWLSVFENTNIQDV